MRPITVGELGNPLGEIGTALLRSLPRAGIVGVGLGARVRERTGRICKQIVIRVVVRKKLRPLPRGTPRIPAALLLESVYLGQRVRVRVPCDVQTRPTGVPTFLAISLPGREGRLSVGAYARWTERGQPHLGVVTAGHGCWRQAQDARPQTRALLDLGPSCEHGPLITRVRAASHLQRDGVDVAVLDLGPQQSARGRDPCLLDIWQRTQTAGQERLTALLGGRGDERQIRSTFKHFLVEPGPCASLAYFTSIQVRVQGWGLVRFQDAVETRGSPASFIPGTSGLGIVSQPTGDTPREALALQSVCLDPASSGGRWRWSLGTSVWKAQAWLAANFRDDLTLHWDLDR